METLRVMNAIAKRGRRLPLHATSCGKVLAAHDPLLADARIALGFPPRTVTDPAEFLRICTRRGMTATPSAWTRQSSALRRYRLPSMTGAT
jgi:DNA-binding IclR family transcriptional regulator